MQRQARFHEPLSYNNPEVRVAPVAVQSQNLLLLLFKEAIPLMCMSTVNKEESLGLLSEK